VVVAVAGSAGAPEVLERRRIELADRNVPGSVQPYHRARELALEEPGLGKAQAHISRTQSASRELAWKAIQELIDDWKQHEVRVCGVLMGSGRPLANLAATLGSHPAIHSAEGEFFREAVIDAAERSKLTVRRVKEKELLSTAGTELAQRVDRLGKILGSPWRQDEKYATLAGLLALAE
jgi:hypothetical protein